jgi:hypothetical protein
MKDLKSKTGRQVLVSPAKSSTTHKQWGRAFKEAATAYRSVPMEKMQLCDVCRVSMANGKTYVLVEGDAAAEIKRLQQRIAELEQEIEAAGYEARELDWRD